MRLCVCVPLDVSGGERAGIVVGYSCTFFRCFFFLLYIQVTTLVGSQFRLQFLVPKFDEFRMNFGFFNFKFFSIIKNVCILHFLSG